jgi:hypothetical protein
VTGPGASADLEYRIRHRGRVGARLAAVVIGAGAGAGGWWALAAGSHRTGVVLWVLAAGMLILATRPWFGGRDIERWRRGATGERRTAEMLELLPARRWVVRHDLRLPGSRANIDHVVVGRTGVWVLDTKTTRAPVTARWRRVYMGDRRLDTSSLAWEVEALGDRLQQTLDRHDIGLDVTSILRPLVVVHGGGLRLRGGHAGGVRVVPAGRAVHRLRRGRRRLRRSEVRVVADALDRAFPVGPAGRQSRAWPGRQVQASGRELSSGRVSTGRSHG